MAKSGQGTLHFTAPAMLGKCIWGRRAGEVDSEGRIVEDEDAQHRCMQKGEALTPLLVSLKLADLERGLAVVLVLRHQDLDD